MEASKADLEWSARIDQALDEYPEMREYLDAIRGNIETLSTRLAAVRELADTWEGNGAIGPGLANALRTALDGD